MEDEYEDAADALALAVATMRRDHLDVGSPSTSMLSRDIAALESIAADLRALLARAETEAA